MFVEVWWNYSIITNFYCSDSKSKISSKIGQYLTKLRPTKNMLFLGLPVYGVSHKPAKTWMWGTLRPICLQIGGGIEAPSRQSVDRRQCRDNLNGCICAIRGSDCSSIFITEYQLAPDWSAQVFAVLSWGACDIPLVRTIIMVEVNK